jgi:23S rRNA (uridine2552-2'-O)-methyltransferase
MALLSLLERKNMKVKTKSKKVNKSWLNDHVNDPYVKLAKKEGYRARAAYKLKEIDETFGLIKPGNLVVDLGSAPGAWSQYVRRRLSPQGAAAGDLNGTILAVDLLPMEPVEGVHFIQGDFTEADVLAQLQAIVGDRPVDVVVSDMAPNLSGIADTDAARIAHLIELAVDCLPSSVHLNGGVATLGDLRSRCGNSEACIAPPCTPVHSPPAKHPARVARWMDAALVWLLALWLRLWLLEAGLRLQ